MYTNKQKFVLNLLALFIVMKNASSINTQNEKPDEISSTAFKTTDKPRTSRLKSQKSYMSNPSSLHEITDSGFPDVTYPTSIIDAREQFYFGSGGLDDVLRPFSDDVRNSYKALKTDKVTYTKPLEEINVANRKKPSILNQPASPILNKDNLSKLKSLNSCDEIKKISNDFNITKDDANETSTYCCLNPIENDLNMTTSMEDVEDSILLLVNKTQLDIWTELENMDKPSDIDFNLENDAKAETFSTDSKEKYYQIMYENSFEGSDLGDSEISLKLNNTRNIYDSILNGGENMQPLERIPLTEETTQETLLKDYQTGQDKQSTIQVIHDEEPIRHEELRIMSDDWDKSIESPRSHVSNFNSDVVSNISDGVPEALMLGQANDNTLDSITEMFKKDVLALFNTEKDKPLELHDNTGWLFDPTELKSDYTNVLYKIYLVGPVSMFDSIDLEEVDSNELNMKSAANSISAFDGFKSAKKPLSVLFNFSSSDS